MLEKIFTCKRMQEFLLTAHPGDSAIYHVGHLGFDRVGDRELGFLAGALFRLSQGVEIVRRDNSDDRLPGSGALCLTQSRTAPRGNAGHAYRATILRHCNAAEIAAAFMRKKPMQVVP